jgi:hypothetical protein
MNDSSSSRDPKKMSSRGRRRSIDDVPADGYLLRIMGLTGKKIEPTSAHAKVTSAGRGRPHHVSIELHYGAGHHEQASKAKEYLSKPHLVQKRSRRWVPSHAATNENGVVKATGTISMTKAPLFSKIRHSTRCSQ